MLLRELIADYLAQNNLSYRAFAKKCDVSNSYLSMIKNDVNPSTGKPPLVTIVMLNKIAKGMDITLHQLCGIVDDMPVDIGEEPKSKIDLSKDEPSDRAMEIARAYDAMSSYGKSMIDKIVENEGKYMVVKAMPTLEDATGFKVGHDSDVHAKYNAMQELKELSVEELEKKPSRILR